jgi:hypothetical protein
MPHGHCSSQGPGQGAAAFPHFPYRKCTVIAPWALMGPPAGVHELMS